MSRPSKRRHQINKRNDYKRRLADFWEPTFVAATNNHATHVTKNVKCCDCRKCVQ